ncbi:hypothetical protein MF1_03540 [Bartonella quintana]|nr:hypothetical protein MF1_03540 [Bartonella quintana]
MPLVNRLNKSRWGTLGAGKYNDGAQFSFNKYKEVVLNRKDILQENRYVF